MIQHFRYDYNHSDFVAIQGSQHYTPLLQNVSTTTLVIDINLVNTTELPEYLNNVLDKTNLPNFKQIIFDGTQDPVYGYSDKAHILNNWAKEKGIKCFLAMSQFELEPHSDLIEINYPSWLYVFKQQQLPKLTFTEKQYNFSSLNRNPSAHRLLFYSLVKQRGLLDEFVYTFYNRCPYQGHLITPKTFKNLYNLCSPELATFCLENIKDFPIAWPNDEQGQNDHSINHPAYQNAYCNIVTETSAAVAFTSEKIWKPIAAGQLFYIVGAPGTNLWLKKLGYFTFDDGYDLQDKLEDRLTSVADRIAKQSKMGIDQWYRDCRDQISHNYELFHSGAVEANILAPIIELLN